MTQTTTWAPLSRGDVIKAIERRNPPRIPLVRAKWWGEGLHEQYGARLNELDRYPEDVVALWIQPLDFQAMDLSWELDLGGAHDARVVVDEWAKLDEFIEKLPDPECDPQIDALLVEAERAHAADRYVIFSWWGLFFERPWGVRGMANLLMDYHLHPEEVHRLHDALANLYNGYIRRAARELAPDGFWTSDDLGHQTQPFMRPRTFKAMLKPYYAKVGEVLRETGMHWWLHSCGNNTLLLDDLVEVGVDVFHPVQKGTMDELAVAHEYGDRLTFLAGIDVQHTLQQKGPAGVREEVRFLIDTFDQANGGMAIAAGNGIVSGTPFENIEAFLDEAVRYGTQHRRR